MNKIFDQKNLKSVNKVIVRLNNMRRWTDYVCEARYNELAKQALNCIVAYILVCYYEKDENSGPVDWAKLPKIALHRAFQKAFVNYNTPENILDEIFALAEKDGLDRSKFREIASKKIEEETAKEFAEFLAEGLNSIELDIFQNATKIATLIELENIKSKIGTKAYAKKYMQIKSEIDFNLPGVKMFISETGDTTELYDIIKEISRLRNQNRWTVQTYRIECSVLGHLFDTGVFAWIMSLEQNPEDEVLASRMFFMGIFHDVAEAWTTDIPSDIKDRVEGFRDLTEKYEDLMLEEHLFTQVSPFMQRKLHEVMFEEKANKKYFALVKGADYLSADSECWRQYFAGTRDDYFLGAIERRQPGIVKGKVLLTPECAKLHAYYKHYAMACVQAVNDKLEQVVAEQLSLE